MLCHRGTHGHSMNTTERYYNSFDFITFEKIILNQSIFVSDITTNMQFSQMKNAIHRSLVTIQYHAKRSSPLYRKVTSNKFCFYIFVANLTCSLLSF